MKEEYQIIDGKPHLGLWYGKCVITHFASLEEDRVKDPIIIRAKDILTESRMNQENSNPDLMCRHVKWIIRPTDIGDPLSIRGTIGLKWMIWGRAYKVMRLLKKGGRRYKKKLINGHRKYVRIDKR